MASGHKNVPIGSESDPIRKLLASWIRSSNFGSADPKEIFRIHNTVGQELFYTCIAVVTYVVVIPVGLVTQIFVVPMLLFLKVETLFIFNCDSSLRTYVSLL
jgi:hypothetical protein